jgi:hypothetical protein
MLEKDLLKYLKPFDLSDDNRNQWLCQDCNGNGASFDTAVIEIICRTCHGRGERRVHIPLIKPKLLGPSKISVHFYITGWFYRFDNGATQSLALYDDLVWRESLNYTKAKCFFISGTDAGKVLRKVSK